MHTATIKQVLARRQAADEIARRENSRLKAQLFDGDARAVLTAYIRRLSKVAALIDMLAAHADTSLNLVHRIPGSIARLYTGKMPVRTIDGKTGYTDTMDGLVPGGLDAFLADVHERTIAHGVTAVRPVVVSKPDGAEFRLVCYDPSNMTVIVGPDGETSAVATDIILGDTAAMLVWTATEFAVVTDQGADITDQWAAMLSPDPSRPRVNPYGVLPFAFFRLTLTGPIWGPAWRTDGLLDGTMSAMLFSTMLRYQTWWGSFRQLIVKGMVTPADVAQFVNDIASVMVVGPGSDVDTLETRYDVDGMRTAINGTIEDVSTGYGMSLSSFRRTSQATSGFARLLEMQGIIDVNNRHMGPFAVGEAMLARAARAVCGYHGLAQIDAGRFHVQFFGPQAARDPNETLRDALLRFMLNLDTLESGLGWAPGTAQARMTENKAHNDPLRELFSAMLSIPPGAMIPGLADHPPETHTDPTRTPADGTRGPVPAKDDPPANATTQEATT